MALKTIQNAANLATLKADMATAKADIATLKGAQTLDATPTTAVVTLTSANTEYTYEFPAGTRRYALRARDGSSSNHYRWAWVTGKVATPTDPYFKVPADVAEFQAGVDVGGDTIYLASATAGMVIQIESWA